MGPVFGTKTMPVIQVRTGTPAIPSIADNNVYDVLGGKSAEIITANLHGNHYTSAVRGNVFYVSTVPAGLAIPISTTTAPTVALWNPAGSGKNAALLRFNAHYVSGTSVASAFGLSFAANAGNTVATGAVFTAFNRSALGTNLFNGLLGGGVVTTMFASANGTNTLTAAGAYFMTMAGESALIATTANNPYALVYDFDGTVVVPPGTAVWVTGSAASGALLAQTLIWEELPV